MLAALVLYTLFMFYGAGASAQLDGAIVHGRVADAEGTPLAGFPVLVVDGGGRAVALRTGRDGRFQTIGLTAGPISVQLDAQDYAQLRVRCRISSGQTAFVELFAARASRPPLPAGRCRIEPPTSDLYIIE